MGRHAEIAGAGMAGLGLSALLAEAGWTVTVHERAEEVREVGAGIALGQNGIDALRRIDTLDACIEGGVQIRYWNIQDQWHRIVQEENLTTELWSVPRSSLPRGLYETAVARGVEVLTSSAVIGAEPDALLLEGGVRRPADLVVGADGVWSKVRPSLQERGLKSRQVDLGVWGLRAIMPRNDLDPRDAMLEWLSGQRRVGLLGLGGNDVAIYMFCPPQDVNGCRVPLDVEDWSRSYPELRHAFERVPHDAAFRPVIETHCASWSLGSAALLGDAAFSMAPNLGQGACTALQAAISLTEHVDGASDIPAALREWERRERPHVDYVQRWSGRYSRLCSKSRGPVLRARSSLFGMWGRSERLNARFAGVEARLLAS